MFRRVTIALAVVATAALVAASPAAAHGDEGWNGGKEGAGHAKVEGGYGSGEFLNLGGPYGITYAEGHGAHFEGKAGYYYNHYLNRH
ncbi:hypothetical protein [Streptomyces albidoflavus]|uniref:hypothetical protein n=1 Tax=Streptomyces albidoflavus TaxID=1886 RepID=UPI00101E34AB|nr:hypothetical protein [Streptomyces albidoflavus]RZD55682.1 hypothetical protein C0Q57_30965 [Streptomyces albidoflavus]RZF01100.1 hypothetical protein C0R04_00020 [Streptomyces albidoflavus]RZF02971.1 hypothetical protein C0R03_00020 [Streptomyces albidoflavus]